MSEPDTSRQNMVLRAIALTGFFGLVAFFLGPSLLEQRDKNAAWYFLHIAGGSLVLLLGPFQFVAPLRNRFRRYHRIAGYTYVAGSALAITGYIGLPKLEMFLTSQLVALALWAVCVLFAIRAIRAGRLLSHEHNMARGFVLACYFLTARIVDRYAMGLLVPLAGSEGIRLAHSDWLAWLIPLLAVEVYFTLKWQSAFGAKASRNAV
jgi:hypothetical protein